MEQLRRGDVTCILYFNRRLIVCVNSTLNCSIPDRTLTNMADFYRKGLPIHLYLYSTGTSQGQRKKYLKRKRSIYEGEIVQKIYSLSEKGWNHGRIPNHYNNVKLNRQRVEMDRAREKRSWCFCSWKKAAVLWTRWRRATVSPTNPDMEGIAVIRPSGNKTWITFSKCVTWRIGFIITEELTKTVISFSHQGFRCSTPSSIDT